MQDVPPQRPPPHAVVFVHGLHTVGSLSLSGVQFGDVAELTAMSAHTFDAGSQIVQHPKQSQPGGESGPHTFTHCCGITAEPSGGKHFVTSYLLPSCVGLLTMPCRSVAHSALLCAPRRQHT